MNIVVIGGGVAGLSAALGLARNGHRVTILERDPAPGDVDIEQAFNRWSRKGVPQIRQGHFVLGRAKEMLDKHAPDVVDALAEEGIVPASNPMLAVLSPDELLPGDDLTPMPTRRIPLELTFRRIVEREPSVEIRSGVKAVGVSTTNGDGRPPRITGVGLDDGSEIAADFVIDAGGRRSPVAGWLRDRGATIPADRVEDCGITYYGRYFRAKGDAPDPWVLLSSGAEPGYLSFTVFPGDNGTYGVVIIAPSWDMDLRALREVPVWETVAERFPSIGQWTNSDFASPLTSVDVTAGHANVLRSFLNDGVPSYLGSLPVGDALCTTDARYAWGLSLGFTTGFAAADAVSSYPHDPGDAALAYSNAVYPELEECFGAASALSRIVARMWKGTFQGPEDPDEGRELLLAGVLKNPALIFSDPVLLRGAFRRINLTGSPNAVFEDPEFVAKAQSALTQPAEASNGHPSRDDLVRLMAGEKAPV